MTAKNGYYCTSCGPNESSGEERAADHAAVARGPLAGLLRVADRLQKNGMSTTATEIRMLAEQAVAAAHAAGRDEREPQRWSDATLERVSPRWAYQDARGAREEKLQRHLRRAEAVSMAAQAREAEAALEIIKLRDALAKAKEHIHAVAAMRTSTDWIDEILAATHNPQPRS